MVRKRNGRAGGLAIGNNPGRSRSHNRRVVLEAIRLHGPMGRAEIARLSHLTAQAVSNIAGELIGEGLLIEQGRLRTGRGQPPVQLAVNPDGGTTVGVEIAADHIVMVLVDLAGNKRAERFIAAPNADPAHTIPLLTDGIAELRRNGGSAGRSLGIGVVMPGPFEIEGLSSVGPTTLPGWAGIDAASVIAEATGEVVTVENDATAAAVGERLHGVVRDVRDFCLLYFGVGLGLGIVVDGRPYRGAFGNAGEVGHLTVVPGGKPCFCGNRGCLERYASLYALQERFREAGRPLADLSTLADLHRAGDPLLLDWLDEAARHLAPMIGLLENLFDPQTIVFAGALPDVVIDALIDRMTPLPLSVASRFRAMARVMRGESGRYAAALGAAALPLLETVTPKLDMAPVAMKGDAHAVGS